MATEAVLKEYCCGVIKRLLLLSMEDVPFDEMLESVIDRVVSAPAAPITGGGIWVMEDPGRELRLKAYRGLPGRLAGARARLPLGECVCGKAETGRADCRTDAGAPGELRYGRKPPGDHCCVPVVFRGKTLGVISLFKEKGHPMDMREEEFIRAVASIVCGVIERERGERAMESLLRVDRVTGLLNSESFTGEAAKVLENARHKKRLAAVLTLDLDRFRVINETMGFEAGNELLRAVAQRLKVSFYETDLLARTGEDEFAVLLQEVSRAEDTFKVIRKVSQALSAPFRAGGEDIRVTAAIGVSIYPSDGEHAPDLIKNSRTAMNRAKETGRSGRSIYSPAMDEKAAALFRIEGMLRKALENDEFVLHFQPKCDLKTGVVIGTEALIRWQNPEMGLISPGDFIPIAEESGMIIDVGAWCLKMACSATKRLHRAGFNGLTVSVNLSPTQFKDGDFPERLTRILEKADLPPGYLELELTERVIMHNAEEIINAMHELKEKGVRLSIDDFGTGYSSLSYLKRLPIDILKIDRSFVMNVPGNSDDVSIAVAIMRFAHGLKLEVVAEGVETAEQLDFFRDIGCDVMQGFLFSRPLPEEKLMTLLKEGKRLF